MGAYDVDRGNLEAMRLQISAHLNALSARGITTEFFDKDITAAMDRDLFYTSVAITATLVRGILPNGTVSPSVTYQLKHDPDRSAAGSALTASTVLTNITTGADATLDVVAIPAGSWVWLESTAQSGTVPQMVVFVGFTLD